MSVNSTEWGFATAVDPACVEFTDAAVQAVASPSLGVVRFTHFRQRMDDEFGPIRATAMAKDHVFSELGGRTVDDALEAGMDTKRVWSVVCTAFDVPPERR